MQLNSKARGKAAQLSKGGIPPDWSQMTPQQQQQAMAVNMGGGPMGGMMMNHPGVVGGPMGIGGPHGNMNMGPGGPLMGGGIGPGGQMGGIPGVGGGPPGMMAPPDVGGGQMGVPHPGGPGGMRPGMIPPGGGGGPPNMQGNPMMQPNDMQFNVPPNKRQNFGPNGPPMGGGGGGGGGPMGGGDPGGGPFHLPHSMNSQDPNFQQHGVGGVPGNPGNPGVGGGSVPGPQPVNNTYINATMSIGQVNIQSVQPGPGGFPMGAPSMNASQINTSMSQMGSGPSMMNANISTSMNDPNTFPTMSQAQQVC